MTENEVSSTEDSSQHPIKFYQTGTFTVGNRLLDKDQRSVQATQERPNTIDSGECNPSPAFI